MSLQKFFRPVVVHETDGRGSEVVYLTVTEVAKQFPPSRNGRPVHVATVTRWITHGARLRGGTRLRLKAIRLPQFHSVNRRKTANCIRKNLTGTRVPS